jgi:orotate phosphoribosyltransferase-like protein
MAKSSSSKNNKIQNYAAQWLHHTGLSNEDIAKELSLDIEKVNSMITSETSPEPSNTSKSRAKNLMITHTSGKKINSVAIMTQEASEVCDAARQSAPPAVNDRGIFRPKS